MKAKAIDQRLRAALCQSILDGDCSARDKLASLYMSAGYHQMARAIIEGADKGVMNHARAIVTLARGK